MAAQFRRREARGAPLEDTRYIARVVARTKLDQTWGRDRKKARARREEGDE